MFRSVEKPGRTTGSRGNAGVSRRRAGRGAAGIALAVACGCEQLERRQFLTVTVANASFESPHVGGGAGYQYDPSGATWVFAGNAGIEHNGSGFNAANAPNGQQAAFLQSNVTANQDAIGTISQALTFTAGTYTVSFDAAQRPSKGVLPIEFLVDGVQVGNTITPASSTTWNLYTTGQFTIAGSGNHTIEFTGVDATTADKDSFIDAVSVNAVTPPTVATAAAATPSTVTGTSTALSVLGADAAGESSLTYAWSATGTPPGAVTFSPNGTNAAKNTTATFSAAGTYNLLATITDANGLTATSSVSVTVNQTQTSVAVSPASISIVANATQQFTASALDQFGNAMASQPAFTWSKTGIGSISSAGLYQAPPATGAATVTATGGGLTSNSASVSVVTDGTPTVATAAAATPSPATGATASLSVLGSDAAGESTLSYAWSLTGNAPAVVTFSANGTNAAKNTTAAFTTTGTYNFLVTITNGSGLAVTSSVSVTVNQTLSSIAVTPAATSIAAGATQQYSAIGFDQFGNAMVAQPTLTWSTAGAAGASGSTAIGSIGSSSGLFTASATAGTGTVTATAGGVFGSAQISVGGAPLLNGTVTLSTFGINGYYTVDTNSCAIAVDNLWTDAKSNFQFAAYYTSAGKIMLARRQVGASSWQVFDSGITDTTISDDHDVISIAIDSAGYLHMSWGMHNIPLNYAISNTPVTGAAMSALACTIQTAANAPTLFPASGATTNEVTYPQFYAIPNSSKLLFAYRNGGAGGGSGNGNEYFDIYNPTTRTWTNNFVINGELTSVNAYLNRMVFDSNNNLLMSWTWRATPNWQSNSNIMFAQSPDVGTTWYQQGGTTQYTLPIIQSGTPAASVAPPIENIPQGSSFINQTSMTVDASNNPLIATYMAPGYNVATSSGNPNLQYMLYYYYNGKWNTSQITNRTSDTAIDSSGADVRDLGRPVVLVDKQGRVLVVTRSEDTSMGSYASPSTPNNDIVVYYSTNLHTASPTWQSVTLNTTNMGDYEATYDQNLWTSQNKLSLFFEPVGLTGQTSGTVQTLDWNEQAYFNPTPTSMNVSPPAAAAYGSATATFGGTVSQAGNFPPAGETVAVTLNGVTINAPLNAQGQFSAQFDTSHLPVSATPYAVTYSYAGDWTFGPAADSTTTTLTVSQATPAISWTNPADITYGTALSSTQLDASASFQGQPLAGTFTYSQNGGTVLSAGLAQTLSASFTPSDTTDFTTAPATATINVQPAGSVTSVTAANGSANPAPLASPVSFTATVAPSAPATSTPTGSIQFQVDGANVGTPVTLTNGSATSAAMTNLSSGSHQITALYTPDTGNFNTSASTPFSQVIQTAISAWSINGGAAQRSMVTSITVAFTQGIASLDPNAFTLQTSTGGAVSATITPVISADGLSVTLTFSGAGVIAGSLADGSYVLTAHANLIHDVAGAVLASDQTLSFKRLFGDADGNGVVNALDYIAFKNAYGLSSGQVGYSAWFDYDGNGVINALDYAQFKKRFG